MALPTSQQNWGLWNLIFFFFEVDGNVRFLAIPLLVCGLAVLNHLAPLRHECDVVHVHIKPERNVNIRLQVREVKCFQLANQRQDYREACTRWAFSTFYFCSWFLLLLLSVLQLNWVWVLGIPRHLRLLRVQLCGSKQDNMMHTERLFNYCSFCSTFFSFGI